MRVKDKRSILVEVRLSHDVASIQTSDIFLSYVLVHGNRSGDKRFCELQSCEKL